MLLGGCVVLGTDMATSLFEAFGKPLNGSISLEEFSAWCQDRFCDDQQEPRANSYAWHQHNATYTTHQSSRIERDSISIYTKLHGHMCVRVCVFVFGDMHGCMHDVCGRGYV